MTRVEDYMLTLDRLASDIEDGWVYVGGIQLKKLGTPPPLIAKLREISKYLQVVGGKEGAIVPTPSQTAQDARRIDVA
tara:strand:- start:3538 stop:3771 length:234 start_codon:yes stop_codon:yes gene_type:complete